MTIHCVKCGTYCGEIRDASLKKGLKYICGSCYANGKTDAIPDFFKEIFRGKK